MYLFWFDLFLFVLFYVLFFFSVWRLFPLHQVCRRCCCYLLGHSYSSSFNFVKIHAYHLITHFPSHFELVKYHQCVPTFLLAVAHNGVSIFPLETMHIMCIARYCSNTFNSADNRLEQRWMRKGKRKTRGDLISFEN